MMMPTHAQLMARYNRWQNQSLYDAAGRASDADRRRDQGSFFGSIHATLNHLVWADRIWMHRFAATPPPPGKNPKESTTQFESFDDLARERAAFDLTIIDWADRLVSQWLGGELTWYSGAANREITRPRWRLVTHFFNHQTHHRGQVHAMLTRLGIKPGDTDLMLME